MTSPFTIGSLVTISGDTKPYREYLKKIGAHYNATLKVWLVDDLLLPSVQELSRRAIAGELTLAPDEAPSTTRTASVVEDWRLNVNAQGTRTGKRWPPEEQEALLSSVQALHSLEDIAVEHKRAVTAISSRLREAADALLNAGVSEYEVMKQTLLSADEIKMIQQFGAKGDWRSRGRAERAKAVVPQAVLPVMRENEVGEVDGL